MKATQKIRQANLTKWAALFQEQAASGLRVKDWCAQNEVSINAFYYWKRIAKEAYVNSIIPDIVSLPSSDSQELSPSSHEQSSHDLYKLCDSTESFNPPTSHDLRNLRDSGKTTSTSPSPVSITVGDIHIEIDSAAPEDLILKIIKAVRYA